jgi:hypothetical protein
MRAIGAEEGEKKARISAEQRAKADLQRAAGIKPEPPVPKKSRRRIYLAAILAIDGPKFAGERERRIVMSAEQAGDLVRRLQALLESCGHNYGPSATGRARHQGLSAYTARSSAHTQRLVHYRH